MIGWCFFWVRFYIFELLERVLSYRSAIVFWVLVCNPYEWCLLVERTVVSSRFWDTVVVGSEIVVF